MPPYVLDASALIAVFNSYPPVTELLERAAAVQTPVVLPAVAVADANAEVKGSFGAWESILLPKHVVVANLDGSTAIEVGQWPGDLGARHTMYEAREVRGVVVTREPAQYAFGIVPLLVV